MRDWITLALVIIAYALGHAGGYRLCKLRVRNMLRKLMFSLHHTFPNKDDPLDVVSTLLSQIMKL